jgi:nucleoside-diphosphate-sugar epimerase
MSGKTCYIILLVACSLLLICKTYAKTQRVLVVGGTGRLGRSVVSKLLSQGIETRVLARNAGEARKMEKLVGATIIEGDVKNMNDILFASKDCSAIISTHGVRPTRLSQLQDLFRHPKLDDSHPYCVNFLGTKRILAAMQINKVDKLVRITGALVDKNEFLPFVYLFNLLLSKTIKWHEATEIAIRASGVDYTVIRPTGIREKVTLSKGKGNAPSDGMPEETRLVLLPGDSGESAKTPGQISIDDLSDLCIKSITDPRLQGANSKATLIVSTELGKGPSTWDTLLDAVPSLTDAKTIKPRRHNLVSALYSVVLAAVVSGACKSFLLSLFRLLPKGAVTGVVQGWHNVWVRVLLGVTALRPF